MNNLNEIKETLKERKNYLLQIKKEKENFIEHTPDGTLIIRSNKNVAHYYYRTNPKDTSGVYIREENIKLARELAQKDYNQKVLSSTKKELNAIKKYLSACPDSYVEQIYENLHKERQKLVIPIRESDEQYVDNWKSVEYHGKKFSEGMPELYTGKDERVRSKSEIIIADTLSREGIPYRYEYPITLKGLGKVYPDFTVLNIKLRKELYWEHLGMMDDPDYAENAIHKIACYEQNNIFPGDKLILTYETQKNPINQKQIQKIIHHYLQ